MMRLYEIAMDTVRRNILYDLRLEGDLMEYQVKRPFRFLFKLRGFCVSLKALSESIVDYKIKYIGFGLSLLYISITPESKGGGFESSRFKPLVFAFGKDKAELDKQSLLT